MKQKRNHEIAPNLTDFQFIIVKKKRMTNIAMRIFSEFLCKERISDAPHFFPIFPLSLRPHFKLNFFFSLFLSLFHAIKEKSHSPLIHLLFPFPMLRRWNNPHQKNQDYRPTFKRKEVTKKKEFRNEFIFEIKKKKNLQNFHESGSLKSFACFGLLWYLLLVQKKNEVKFLISPKLKTCIKGHV